MTYLTGFHSIHVRHFHLANTHAGWGRWQPYLGQRPSIKVVFAHGQTSSGRVGDTLVRK